MNTTDIKIAKKWLKENDDMVSSGLTDDMMKFLDYPFVVRNYIKKYWRRLMTSPVDTIYFKNIEVLEAYFSKKDNDNVVYNPLLPKDPFIISGSEKVIVSQERLKLDNIKLFKNSNEKEDDGMEQLHNVSINDIQDTEKCSYKTPGKMMSELFRKSFKEQLLYLRIA